MLRLLLRSVAINLAGVYIAFSILSGVVSYVGGVKTLLSAAALIVVVNLVVRPIVNLLLLPINLITVGLFRWVANLATLYIVVHFIPNIQIAAFTFPGLKTPFLIIPSIHFSAFGAYLVATLTLAAVFHLLYWLLQD
jgi:putative membrane protein